MPVRPSLEPRATGTAARRRPAVATLVFASLLALAPARARAVPETPFWLRAARAVDMPLPAPASGGDWFRLAVEASRKGRYADAVAAYEAVLAGGATDTVVYANLGEVLMAEGHLREAEGRYRDAIAAASEATPGRARARVQDLALGYYGLAVALDRDGQPVAALEMMGRALAQDPTAAVLTVASLPSGDLSFVPDGEVFYYRGLAALAGGHRAEASAGFHDFLERRPQSPWAARARAHLAELAAAAAGAPPVRTGRGPRVVATGTVLAAGAVAAPQIDAAWHDRPSILDDCLDASAGLGALRESIRFAIELEIDRHGRVARAVVKGPPPIDVAFASCVETAVKARLRLPSPSPSRATLARTEVILGFPSP